MPALLLAAAVALSGTTPYAQQQQPSSPSQAQPAGAQAAQAGTPAVEPALFEGLRWRMVGPHRGGRVTGIAGHKSQPHTFYMGATGGGVWKTTDYGQHWANVSDGFFETASIGAIEVAEADPNLVFVGTGSPAIRSNVIRGRGVYRSTDAGKTWQHVGLRDVGQIGAVRVHPQNTNLVYVAALGQPFGDGPERGVFRSADGGKTWQKVLFINDRTGVVSLAINPSNPKELYAGAWRGQRKPWTIISGGPAAETGLYKSTDGGDTWTHLTDGLPRTLIGKVDVEVSRSNPSRVYAILEAPGDDRGVYRSDDSGRTWKQVNNDIRLITRPFYYTYIDIDPKNPDIVWVNNLQLWKSTDGGASFSPISTPHGDNHGIWINPDNPDIVVQSNDGGANVSLNGGASWSTQYNQPTAELYQVEVDAQFPYRLYAAQQDNTTVIVPSLPPMSSPPDDPLQLWMPGAGCETGPIKPKPDDPSIVYGVCKGEFYRLSLKSGQSKSYWVYPQDRYGHAPRDIKYRFQRTSPFEISPHDPRVIYHTSHVVHRTRDEGVTWEVISPDLTANEPDKQGIISGEPITRDITGEEVYSAIYAFRESPLEPGLLWSGANDGPVYVSRDAGKRWTHVTPKDLPPGGRIQQIEVSPHRKGSAYIAAYRYLLDDWRPYIYRTDDYGATWTRLTDGTNGIPADYPTRVVREDPDREGLLYAGTEYGMFVSFDNGRRWQPFQLNLPVTPITDMRVYRKDLVISTMGRGFWILDNVTPLHAIGGALASSTSGRRAKAAVSPGNTRSAASNGEAAGDTDRLAADGSTAIYLHPPRPAYRVRHPSSGGSADQPEYPAPGAHIDYYIGAEPAAGLTLEIRDARGTVLRTFSTADGAGLAAAPAAGMRGPARGRGGVRPFSKARGFHRFVWDMRHPGPAGAGQGPYAVPGNYQVRLTAGDWSATRPLTLVIDPRVAADGVTQADLDAQLALNLKIRDAIIEARQAADRVARARKAATDPEVIAKLEALTTKLVTASGAYPQPMLIEQFGNLYRMTTGGDQKVGRDGFVRYDDLRKELDALLRDVSAVAP